MTVWWRIIASYLWQWLYIDDMQLDWWHMHMDMQYHYHIHHVISTHTMLHLYNMWKSLYPSNISKSSCSFIDWHLAIIYYCHITSNMLKNSIWTSDFASIIELSISVLNFYSIFKQVTCSVSQIQLLLVVKSAIPTPLTCFYTALQ